MEIVSITLYNFVFESILVISVRNLEWNILIYPILRFIVNVFIVMQYNNSNNIREPCSGESMPRSCPDYDIKSKSKFITRKCWG